MSTGENTGRMRTTGFAALAGLACILPFAVLETMNNAAGGAGDVLLLFGVLWLLAATSIGLVITLAGAGRVGIGARTPFVLLVLRLALSLVVAAVWVGIIADQWPCFLGAPNCD